MSNTGPAQTGPDAAAEFAAGLKKEHAALAVFTRLLQAEQDALVQGDIDRLAELGNDKQVQLELLAYLGECRNRHLTKQNLNANAEGMMAWLNRNPGFAAAVRKIWQELLAQAQKAQQLNQQIGELIASRMQQNRLKLAVLQAAAAPDGVYRPDGQLRPLHNPRFLSQI